jgi:hypothetical protein
VTSPQLTDERLAWLAVRGQLKDLSQPNGVLHFFMRLGRARSSMGSVYTARGPYGQVNQDADFTSRKMRTYAVAVDELSRRLTKDERAVLRESRTVPAWFMPAVIEEAKKIRIQ